MMNSKDIRKKYLEFFESKGHTIVASAPMVIKDDPTLMFTNAGMNQFKDIFLGNSPAKSKRVVDSQKCLRVSGKHNDLEEVGVDTYHHTMFEMLGNWSFGDYFKKEAIHWAWELLTEVYKLDKDDLYVTIFEGDQKDGTKLDEEAYEYWKEIIEEDRIIPANKADNFWEMGETGPCGPCSEIHVDLRSDEEKKQTPGKDLVNMDHPQVVEIWNLVFMEFNRKASGELVSLPSKHIDTGMGFERLAMAIQKKRSNYDTDVFTPLISRIEKITNTKYTATDSKKDVAIRVISDHVRAVSFSIADGQLPSNTGAGYVIRRILRRAIRYSFSFLGKNESFIYQLVAVLTDQMGDYFTELKAQQSLIEKVIKEEEESFLRTLDKGISRLNKLIEETKGNVLDGKQVFELYDTFGFPVDLTALIASEQNKNVDEKGFEDELDKQRTRSRSDAKIETGDWIINDFSTEKNTNNIEAFIGYDSTEKEVVITRYRKVKSKGKDLYQLVFNQTPFYPEGGGQVGDIGHLEQQGNKTYILDTKKENNLIIHFTKELPSKLDTTFKAVVNSKKQKDTARNHTATHLLHHALRETLGLHVEQKGSLVKDSYLRFDFSHFSKVTSEELRKIEGIVNQRIRENIQLNEHRAIPMEEAKERGAMMLFGEKYGDQVRMIEFGDSKELCGGIHVKGAGEIGTFRFTYEGAVAAGIRRIEAVTGSFAEAYINKQIDELDAVKGLLKNPKDLSKSIKDLQENNKKLIKQIEVFNKEKSKNIKGEILKSIENINGVNFIAQTLDLDAGQIKDLCFQLKGEVNDLFALFGSSSNGKATITCVISEELAKAKDYHAGNIIRELAKEINGGGGGQPFFATAGGKNPDGLAKVMKMARGIVCS